MHLDLVVRGHFGADTGYGAPAGPTLGAAGSEGQFGSGSGFADSGFGTGFGGSDSADSGYGAPGGGNGVNNDELGAYTRNARDIYLEIKKLNEDQEMEDEE